MANDMAYEAETRVERDLPGFSNTQELCWSDADDLTHRWAQLNDKELEAAAGQLPLEQLRSLFVFTEGICREHHDRGERAGALSERLRSVVRRSSSFGQDEIKEVNR